jgi:hypothetical protein
MLKIIISVPGLQSSSRLDAPDLQLDCLSSDTEDEEDVTVVKISRYLRNPTDISENRVARHLKVSLTKISLILSVNIVSYDKNRIDPTCESCVNRPTLAQLGSVGA